MMSTAEEVKAEMFADNPPSQASDDINDQLHDFYAMNPSR